MKKASIVAAFLASLLVAACGGGGGGDGGNSVVPPPVVVTGPAWSNFGRDVQHGAQSGIATQSLARIVWQTPVDLVPPYLANNVLHIPLRLARDHGTEHRAGPGEAQSRWRLPRRRALGATGALLWSAETDYVLPAHDWTPSYNIAVTQGNRVYWPGAGGKLFFRDNADAAGGAVQTIAFYGNEAYDAARAAYDASVIISTPLSVDPRGNVYFGFIVTGATPLNLASGIARVSADGSATWVGARTAASDPQVAKPAMNSAPALSNDLSTVLRRRHEFAARGRTSLRHAAGSRCANARDAEQRGAARSRDRPARLGERQRKRVADRRPGRRRLLRRARVEHPCTQFSRMALALQRRT
jgi:hypothetical protein